MAAPKQKLLIIDGNALIHRSFHALPPLTDSKGQMVQAVYGFAATLLKAWKELKPTHIVATFDLRGPTFRDELYEAYKATRVKAPDELYQQIPLVKEMVASFNIPIYEKKGFEADDVIGTITKEAKGVQNIILTGDMDSMQLVDDHTKVFTMRKGLSDTIIYDESGVRQRYGLRPDQIIDYKALRGDPSDNIPGVKGIGEKTATELLQKFETLEDLYQTLEKNTKAAQAIRPAIREKLLTHRSEAFLSKKLATIKRDVPIEFDLSTAAVQNYDRSKVVRMFQDLNFKSLLSKLPEIEPVSVVDGGPAKKISKQAAFELYLAEPPPKKAGHDYILVNDAAVFDDFFQQLSKQSEFVVDSETTSLSPWEAKLLGLSFSWKKGQGWYVVAKPEWVQRLKPIMADQKIKKIGHNLKYDVEVLQVQGIPFQPINFDTMVASYVLSPGTRQHGLDALVFNEFGYEMMPITNLIGPAGKKQRSMEDVQLEKLAWYSAEDADFTWRLYQVLKPRLEKENITGLFTKVEMPLVSVLVDMELAGIKVDVNFLRELSKKMKIDLEKIEKKIYTLAKHEFNISSPLQLKQVLFEELKIDTAGLGKTKTGVSTAAAELEKMKEAHPIIPLISQYRELSKLISTYLDALPELVNQRTGRVHTSYNQTVAATGRLSSSDPNLQNIPIRTDIGATIRRAFIAERGYRLVSADYSQIELRIIASMANDGAMIESFKKGEDIHTRTAANINGVSLEAVTHQMRRAAKAVNFGIIYGLGYVGLAQGEGISRQEAKAFIEKYFQIHHNIKDWIDHTKKLAHQYSYVETLFGRRRYFPEINSTNQLLVSNAERQAINAPIQGTAADLMKLAMIEVHKKLPTISPKSRLLLQVHDELVVESPDADTAAVAKMLKETMEDVYTLKVPIAVDVGVGKNWGEAK